MYNDEGLVHCSLGTAICRLVQIEDSTVSYSYCKPNLINIATGMDDSIVHACLVTCSASPHNMAIAQHSACLELPGPVRS